MHEEIWKNRNYKIPEFEMYAKLDMINKNKNKIWRNETYVERDTSNTSTKNTIKKQEAYG